MLIPPRFLWAPLFNCEKFVTEARQSCVGSPRAPVLLWVSASETRRKSSEVSPMFINTIWCKLSSKLFKITSRLCCLPRSARMPSPQTGCSSDVRAPRHAAPAHLRGFPGTPLLLLPAGPGRQRCEQGRCCGLPVQHHPLIGALSILQCRTPRAQAAPKRPGSHTRTACRGRNSVFKSPWSSLEGLPTLDVP